MGFEGTKHGTSREIPRELTEIFIDSIRSTYEAAHVRV